MESNFLSDFGYIGLIAVALGTDAFSVALGIGAGKRFHGQSFRLGFHFGLFQTLMPLIGWTIGKAAIDWVRSWDHWLASGVVLVVAIHILVQAASPDRREHEKDLSRGWYLVSLSVATSMDALAIGLVFGVLGVAPWWPSLMIGCVAGGMTLIGLFLGRYLRALYGRAVEIAGGILLLFVAAKLFTI